MIPSKKHLAILLSEIKDFEKPNPDFEQYLTPSNVAATLLWIAFMDKNIENKNVADFGSGTGIFSFGASLLGAKSVTGYEIDPLAIAIAKKNQDFIEKTRIPIGKITFVLEDVSKIFSKYDTVLMNPPFGVQKRNADQIFLQQAFETAEKVYSIHKAETSQFLQTFAKEHNFSATLLEETEIILGHTMEFHEKQKHKINIGLWRFVKNGT